MSTPDLAFLCLIGGAFTLFGLALAWASWAEGREAKRRISPR